MPNVDLLDAARIWYNKTVRGDGPSAGGPDWTSLSDRQQQEYATTMMKSLPQTTWFLKPPMERCYLYGEPVLNIGETVLPSTLKPEYKFGTGVPYFALAREHKNADYGLVLTYSDILEHRPMPSWQEEAARVYMNTNPKLRDEVFLTFKREFLRRVGVTNGVD